MTSSVIKSVSKEAINVPLIWFQMFYLLSGWKEIWFICVCFEDSRLSLECCLTNPTYILGSIY